MLSEAKPIPSVFMCHQPQASNREWGVLLTLPWQSNLSTVLRPELEHTVLGHWLQRYNLLWHTFRYNVVGYCISEQVWMPSLPCLQRRWHSNIIALALKEAEQKFVMRIIPTIIMIIMETSIYKITPQSFLGAAHFVLETKAEKGLHYNWYLEWLMYTSIRKVYGARYRKKVSGRNGWSRLCLQNSFCHIPLCCERTACCLLPLISYLFHLSHYFFLSVGSLFSHSATISSKRFISARFNEVIIWQ